MQVCVVALTSKDMERQPLQYDCWHIGMEQSSRSSMNTSTEEVKSKDEVLVKKISMHVSQSSYCSGSPYAFISFFQVLQYCKDIMGRKKSSPLLAL